MWMCYLPRWPHFRVGSRRRGYRMLASTLRYHVNGADVEISTVERPTESDAIEYLGSGPWTHYVDVPCGAHTVPAVQLENHG
jgi:hypothetical protein